MTLKSTTCAAARLLLLPLLLAGVLLLWLMAGALLTTPPQAQAESAGGTLQQKDPNVDYIEGTDFTVPASPTPVGNSVAAVTAVDYGSADSGCESADFAGLAGGNIALVSRGTCPFADKVLNAQAAGASGVLIANNVPGLSSVSLIGASGIGIPALSITKELGDSFTPLSATDLRVHMQVKKEK